MTALDGVRVVEFGDGVAVGYCGALFAACGADVVKVEPPEVGDTVRRLPPFADGVSAPEASGLNAFLSTNKLGVAIDLKSADGVQVARRLAGQADIVLEALGPGGAEACGLGIAELRALNPRLTMVALSWFGADGPRRDWAASDAIVQALSGFLYPIGQKDGPPIIPGGYHAQVAGGLTAFIAAMTALIGAQAGDEGALIDQSILEAYATYTEISGVSLAQNGDVSRRKGLNQFQPTYPQTIYPAADGWIGITALTPPQWRACCDMLGVPDLFDDTRFSTSLDRCDHADELDEILVPLIRNRPARDWFHDAQARRVPFALVPSMADLEELDHFQARGLLARFEHPDLGAFDAAPVPWKFAATPLKQGGRAPRLGEHTHRVLTDRLDLSAADIERLAAAGAIDMGGLSA